MFALTVTFGTETAIGLDKTVRLMIHTVANHHPTGGSSSVWRPDVGNGIMYGIVIDDEIRLNFRSRVHFGGVRQWMVFSAKKLAERNFHAFPGPPPVLNAKNPRVVIVQRENVFRLYYSYTRQRI